MPDLRPSDLQTPDPKTMHICTATYLPLRSAPSHRSEMVSQLLFGERFAITESLGGWHRVITLFDACNGWIDSLHGGYENRDEDATGIITGQTLVCTTTDGERMTIMPGSELFGLSDDLSTFRVGSNSYKITVGDRPKIMTQTSLTGTARLFMSVPYLWGGRTPAGIDASGLVQVVFKVQGIALPREASLQATMGTTIDFIGEAETGDVAFFSGDDGEVSHTGILVGDGSIIHAYGTVRTDRIDHQGIWNDRKGGYTHRLRVIRRMA